MVRTTFRDFDEFAESIAGIEGRFVPTARSTAEWWVHGMQASRVSVQELQIGGCATFAGTGEHEKVAVGVPMTDPRQMRIDGAGMREHCFILMQGPQPFTFTGNGPTRWAGITLPPDHPILNPGELDVLGKTNCVRTRTHPECLEYLRELVNRSLSSDPAVSFATSDAAAAFEQETLLAVALALEHSCEDQGTKRSYMRAHRARVISRCLELMHASRGRPLLIEELVRFAAVSERTLRDLFNDYFGVSPMRLLKATQVWEVRAALLNRQEGEGVMEIAGRFGVWDFSLFSKYYRKFFAECPRQTQPSPVKRTRRDVRDSWLVYAAKILDAQASCCSRPR